jgi:hypothetical protein
MDYFMRETLSRQRIASLVAEADQERLARMCRSEPRLAWYRRLLARLRGLLAAAARRFQSRGSGAPIAISRHSWAQGGPGVQPPHPSAR